MSSIVFKRVLEKMSNLSFKGLGEVSNLAVKGFKQKVSSAALRSTGGVKEVDFCPPHFLTTPCTAPIASCSPFLPLSSLHVFLLLVRWIIRFLSLLPLLLAHIFFFFWPLFCIYFSFLILLFF